jgi:tRNA nucleotidyltransferase/poly(A) polymerase
MILSQTQVSHKLLQILSGSDIMKVVQAFDTTEHKLFLVGGCVRDMFFDKTPKDFDLCTDAKPDQIIDILTKAGIKCEERGAHFGVVVAKLSEDIEIASFRIDEFQDTGANKNTKVVVGVTMEEDVARRDFTINALFFDFKTQQVIDLVGGIDDLHNGVIRAVGDAKLRFVEDNLRKLRAVRFATRFGFEIETETAKAIIDCPDLNVSKERIVAELQNIFKGCKNEKIVLLLLQQTKMIKTIFENVVLSSDDVMFEKLKGCTSFSTFIASIVDKQPDIRKKLFKLQFDSKTCDSVDLLLNWKDCNSSIDFQRKLASTNLTLHEMLTFNPSDKAKLQHLFTFKVPERTVKMLQDAGFEKAELGKVLKQICVTKFKEICH